MKVFAASKSALERLFGVYAESMGDLSSGFTGEDEMRSSYRGFLEDFVSDQGGLVLVEEDDGVWKSALRAVLCGGSRWFIEAVETDPGARRQGYGRLLLLHVAGHLRSLGAKEMTCCVHGDNEASIGHPESVTKPVRNPCYDERRIVGNVFGWARDALYACRSAAPEQNPS